MSEVLLKCPECGRTYCVPAHIADMKMKCRECGTLMHLDDRPEPSPAGRFEFDREFDAGTLRLATVQAEPTKMMTDSVPPSAPSALETVLECTAKVEVTPTWPGYVAFGLTFGLMLLYQIQASAWRSYLDLYVWGRGIALVGLFLYITLAALQDNGWKGTLCIVFPPYALIYGVTQINSYPIQGILFGLVLGLGTEAFFLSKESLVIAAGPAFSVLVDEVNSWIKLASKPPI